MKRTITIDTDLVAVVPIDPATEMLVAGDRSLWPTYKNAWELYRAMLAAVPADLPGVIEHSGEPAIFRYLAVDGTYVHCKDAGGLGLREPLFTHPPAQPDTAALQARIAELEAQVSAQQQTISHWKSNHDHMVEKAAFLSERPDLPVDRIPAYDRMSRQVTEARAISDEHFATILDLRAELEAQLAAQAGQYTNFAPYGWVQFIDGVQTQNFARTEKELDDVKGIFQIMKHVGKAEYIPVFCAQPAPANSLAIMRDAVDKCIQIMSDYDGETARIDAMRALKAQS